MDDPRRTPSCPHDVKFHPAHPAPAPPPPEGEARLSVVAYERSGPVEQGLCRMPPRRGWMDRSANRFAYRCLPLVMANQAGWMIRNPITFSVMWNGGPAASDLTIGLTYGQRGWGGLPPEAVVESHFGEGVLTFQLPYLFRTSEGYNLWVKGPANSVKDGIVALEGLVETDWSFAPFTMNWRLTRPYHTVVFQEGEPVCQLVPYPRGLIERFDPEVMPMTADPELAVAFTRWHAERGQFLKDRLTPGTEAHKRDWQKDYFQGRQAEGGRFREHQTTLETKEFVRTGPTR